MANAGGVSGRVLAAWCLVIGGVSGVAPAAVSPDGFWRTLDAMPQEAALAQPWIQPARYQPCSLALPELTGSLRATPTEFTQAAKDRPLIISLPMPNGSFARFLVVESPIMEEPLAARFPEIKTYSGQGLDDPAATLRFDVTPAGFHAQVLSPEGAVYIDPLFRNNTQLYASYYKRDYSKADDGFRCLTPGGVDVAHLDAVVPAGLVSGAQLRTYRLACAATGEYTAYHGGTVAAGQAAIVTAINRVTGIYEQELAIRLTLVANNSSLVYTNSATDPYTNNKGSKMLGQNQSNVDSVIGSAKIGRAHV